MVESGTVKSVATATQAPLGLRCFLCGIHRHLEDDGRRVRHAQVHVAACAAGPGADGESHLSLVAGDRLEVRLADGAVWFGIARDTLEDVPKPQETILRFYREWYVAVVSGPEGYAGAFASDGTLMPPDSPA